MADPKAADSGFADDSDAYGKPYAPTHTPHVRDDFIGTRNKMDLEHKLPITGNRTAKWWARSYILLAQPGCLHVHSSCWPLVGAGLANWPLGLFRPLCVAKNRNESRKLRLELPLVLSMEVAQLLLALG